MHYFYFPSTGPVVRSVQYDVFKFLVACNDIIDSRVVGFGVSTSVYSKDDESCSYSCSEPLESI